jgi:hypothetical protein
MDMIGDRHFDQLVEAAPVNFEQPKADWPGVAELLQIQGIKPGDVVAVSWCRFSTANIEALVDSTSLAMIHPSGILASSGKRKMLGKSLKFDEIPFSACKQFGPTEYTDERGLGKYCIDFAGPGGVLLGRLWWDWRAKRFRDSRSQIMAVASERDRILEVVQGYIG